MKDFVQCKWHLHQLLLSKGKDIPEIERLKKRLYPND